MSIYDISVTTIDGQTKTLDEYRGQVLLIVNVASRCAFATQYAGLEALYRQYRDRGLVILGFPCDQFGAQELSDEAAIKNFCSLSYDVTFPMFSKVLVNGDDAHPLYKFLKSAKSGLLGTRSIKWNFSKFLVNRDGSVVKRYGPLTSPARIGKDASALLTERRGPDRDVGRELRDPNNKFGRMQP